MDVDQVDQVLTYLQSSDNTIRRQAEEQLEAWSQNPAILSALLTRTHLSASPGSRQLAATILSWKLPKLWPGLAPADQCATQSAMLECFSKCSELPVLKALAEACNSLCQAIALHRDALWEDLMRLVAALIAGESVVHRRAALDLLASLVDSMGLRLQQYYPNIAETLAVRVRDAEVEVSIAALGALAALASSWCQGAEDVQHFQRAADATLEVAAMTLTAPSSSSGAPRLLAASLRTLSRIAPAMQSETLAAASLELAGRIIAVENAPRVAENCRVQALQLLRAFVRRSPQLIGEAALVAAVPAVCCATKDEAPPVDDLDEVSAPALAARDCLRVLARAAPARVVPLVYDAARKASEAVDAVERAAAVHMVVFALCGAHEAPPGWALPLARGLGDNAMWVRQAACEGAVLLSEALQSSPTTTEGLILLLRALAERLPQEEEPEIARKAAEAIAAILRDFTTDEAAGTLPSIVPGLLQALPIAASASQGQGPMASDVSAAMSTCGALGSALAAAAGAAADHFAPFAPAAAAVLLPLLRAGPAAYSSGGALSPHAYAACLDAAGAIVASAWADPTFQAVRDELNGVAQQALAHRGAASEVRASANNFFAGIALASFEEFAPFLPQVVPPAVEFLQTADGSEGGVGNGFRRAVRTGTHEERVAAIEALGAYAAAVGGQFAVHLPASVPAVCAQARHASSDVRAGTARTVARIGRCLGDLSAGLPEGSPDREAAAAMARALAEALCALLAASKQLDGSRALRCSLQARDDLAECSGFVMLAGPEPLAAIAAAAGGQQADDVESSEDEDQEADDADDDH